MPKRTDIHKVLMIGSGPIVIGQACEFDYSGSQACKALREEGYEVVLVNSNPATIMTDPNMADRTYIEPLTVEVVEKIIAREKPDALLGTLGGQTGLNLTVFLQREGILDKYGVESIGASVEAITRAEDRDEFKKTMRKCGMKYPESAVAYSVEEGMDIARKIGLPVILRPAFTLGGSGGSTAYNFEELEHYLRKAISISPVGQVLVEQSVLGWKEIEFEVVRDSADNVVIVTSMENIDAMGVHTGDSMVVAPSQTLSTKEYNEFTDYCRKIIRAVDVTGGGVNIQFAQNPANGDVVIIEVNPRLSRSSALASKATGYPIARIATKLAIGMTLDEITNEITGCTSTFFEPTVDYCVFKVARFTFEKFPKADTVINTSMKSIGEAMSIGRTFNESLQKGLRSLETGRFGIGADGKDIPEALQKDLEVIKNKLTFPNAERLYYVRYAIKAGMSSDEIYDLSKIDPWFVNNIRELVEIEEEIARFKSNGTSGKPDIPLPLLKRAKQNGFSDRQLATLLNSDEMSIRALRKQHGLEASYKLLDTCAGEYTCERPYFYSTYEGLDENRASDNKKVIVLGGGPNRIGQAIEFDYCCSHASMALREMGYDSIMINSNPETVSTDFDTSDRLYFEPLTFEDVLNVIDKESPDGVIVSFGGQTPINLAVPLSKVGVPVLGTSPDSIDRAEDRERFNDLLDKLGLQKPANGIATSFEEADKIAREIGYPILVRPSYVLGGRAMQIVYTRANLEQFTRDAVDVSPEHPVLIDKFLEDAIEVDVDAISDGETTVIGGIMEHIEEAGIHSGDSACVMPPHTLSESIVEEIKQQTYSLAKELGVKGLMNIQYAVKHNQVYVIEVNPRASRTVPFVSKATGVPLARLATFVMLGKTLEELGFTEEVTIPYTAVKEATFPFVRFPGVDTILGPEMKSTGEVMGIDESFGVAFAKAQIAAGNVLPTSGNVFVSVNDKDKRPVVLIARELADMGFEILATPGTAMMLEKNGIPHQKLKKIQEGRPNVIDFIMDNQIALLVCTPSGHVAREAEVSIRSTAVARGVPIITTIAGAQAAAGAIRATRTTSLSVKSIQEYHTDTGLLGKY